MAPKGSANSFMDPDDEVLVPIQTARFRVNGSDRLQSISALAETEEKIPDAMAEIQRVLRRQLMRAFEHSPRRFVITSI